jgi:hypothetical protein
MAVGDYLSVLSHGLLTTEGSGSCDYPAVGDVRDGVSYDSGGMVGTLELPDEADVRLGTGYGEDGTEFTGTLDVPQPTTPGASALSAIVSAVYDLEVLEAYSVGGSIVPVVIRKLPKRREPLDSARRITVNAVEIPDSVRRMAFGSRFLVKYRVEITLVEPNDNDAVTNLTEHTDWKEATRARYQAPGVLAAVGVTRVEIDNSPLLDRRNLVDGYDFTRVGFTCWSYEDRSS